ncbi:type III CRISPR-associated RAMP protein Csx7 [Desulfatirhabdium butyrativorans]|uniref:type III CRISPR-associated RAMP protein Csx7 n=1 Tax=Desulfatirhabdium butyrativorans TaxID=340467 RepID=UPI0004293C2F|nr:CRISPR-associated RAMP protein Csx7 [Desulfatirhabdium butyrativorans]
MLKRLLHRASIGLRIRPIDPILIKSGVPTVSGSDMTFVTTYRFGEPVPYLPGSSLKGVIRSYAETICRSLRSDPPPVCLPYVKPGEESDGEARQASCGLRIEKYLKDQDVDAIPSADAYRLYCPACRIFGAHQFIGRFATADAYLINPNSRGAFLSERRDGVAIDRLTGGAAGGAKYDLEVLTKGEFETTIELQNFERWQLGLLGLVLRDMSDGLVRIGMGKSRGLGRIQVELDRFDIVSYGHPMTRLQGLAGRCTDAEVSRYGLFPETEVGAELPKGRREGLRYVHDILDSWQTILEPALADFIQSIETVPWPQTIEDYTTMRRHS